MLQTSSEMAERLGVTQTTVYRMLADGRIPDKYVTKIGNFWRFNGDAIVEHLMKQPVKLPKKDRSASVDRKDSKMENEELDSNIIINFIKLQAEEGKTPEETIRALMKLVGGEMPEFKKE